jgi:hypothetical protein
LCGTHAPTCKQEHNSQPSISVHVHIAVIARRRRGVRVGGQSDKKSRSSHCSHQDHRDAARHPQAQGVDGFERQILGYWDHTVLSETEKTPKPGLGAAQTSGGRGCEGSGRHARCRISFSRTQPSVSMATPLLAPSGGHLGTRCGRVGEWSFSFSVAFFNTFEHIPSTDLQSHPVSSPQYPRPTHTLACSRLHRVFTSRTEMTVRSTSGRQGSTRHRSECQFESACNRMHFLETTVWCCGCCTPSSAPTPLARCLGCRGPVGALHCLLRTPRPALRYCRMLELPKEVYPTTMQW